MQGAGGRNGQTEKQEASLTQSETPYCGQKVRAARKMKRGYDIQAGKPTGREVQAMQRLQSLTERYIAEGLTPADARTRAKESCELIHAATDAQVRGLPFRLKELDGRRNRVLPQK